MIVPIISPDAVIGNHLQSVQSDIVSNLHQTKSMFFDAGSSSNIFSAIDNSHSFISQVLSSSGEDISMLKLEDVQSRLEEFTLCTQIASKTIGQVARDIDTLIKIQ